MVQLGKRYRCEACGTTLICIKGSDKAEWVCCGQPMKVQPTAKLPSSD